MPLEFDRLFSMAAFEGLRTLRSYLTNNPALDIPTAIQIINEVEVDAPSFDMEAAADIYTILDVDCPNDGEAFYRTCIEILLINREHAWARIMTLGRARFTNKLTRDQLSVFRQAGLLLDPPDDTIVAWWTDTTGEVRHEMDKVRMMRARSAERLTILYETNRLQHMGVDTAPRWMAIEDNTVGYDVLSYEPSQYGLNNVLIEVKSTVASPLRFIITRNEWDEAQKFGDAYFFHVWDMDKDPPVLHVRTVAQVAPHIPADNQQGKWQNAIIPVGATQGS
jgi:hypothetical protein